MPEGETIALAQRLDASWDTRDNPFAATRGILLSGGVEHVDAFDAFASVEDPIELPREPLPAIHAAACRAISASRRGRGSPSP